jgi:hypothetical protein
MGEPIDVGIVGFIFDGGRYFVVQQILPGYKELVCTIPFASMLCGELVFSRRKEWQEQEA